MYLLERACFETGTEAEQQRGGTVGIILICEFLTDVFIRPSRHDTVDCEGKARAGIEESKSKQMPSRAGDGTASKRYSSPAQA